MAQPLLGAGERCLVVTRFEINHPIRAEPSLGQRRRKQIWPRETPQHHAAGAGGDAGGKQGRSGSIDRRMAATGDLMHRPTRKATAAQMGIDRRDPERQHGPPRPAPLKRLDPRAQRLDGGKRPHG